MGGHFTAGRRSGVLALAAGLLAVAPLAAVAQAPPVVPRTTTPLPPTAPVEPFTAPPPPALSPTDTLTQPVFGDPLPPLPGSLEDRYLQELDARRQFQYGTWRGTTLTAFPNSLLWEPPLAVKKDPRMQLLYSNLPNYVGGNTVDTSIGMTMGLYRAEFEAADFATQLDIFGLVLTRLSPDDLMLADYRFGLPLTFRWGWWQAKLAYEHTSAHLGDELIRASGRVTQSFAKDEVVVGVGRYLFDSLRVYGHVGYAFSFQVPGLEGTTREKTRFDVGFEWFLRQPTGWAGTPFAAVNIECRGDQQYDANYTFQAGWLWRNPTMRLGTVRVFVERYDGHSPYGQTIRDRERFTSVGFGFDY